MSSVPPDFPVRQSRAELLAEARGKRRVDHQRQQRELSEHKSPATIRLVRAAPCDERNGALAAVALRLGELARLAWNSALTRHAAPRWQDLDLVFADESGGFLVSRRVERVFKQLCARAELPSIFTPHALRHSTRTYVTASGVPDRVIMQLLGHSSLEMTRRYQHVMSSMMHDAADRLAVNFPSASAAAG